MSKPSLDEPALQLEAWLVAVNRLAQRDRNKYREWREQAWRATSESSIKLIDLN